MSNPLYNLMGNSANPMNDIIRQARELKKTFPGNPRQEVERLLRTGTMSQQQFNQYSQIAQQIVQAMGEN